MATEKMKRQEAIVLQYATMLGNAVVDELAKITDATWTVTPDVNYLNWTLSFRCPGATEDCISVGDTFFSGLQVGRFYTCKQDFFDDVYGGNWAVSRIADSVVSFCIQKCLHKCCRQRDFPVKKDGERWISALCDEKQGVNDQESH